MSCVAQVGDGDEILGVIGDGRERYSFHAGRGDNLPYLDKPLVD
jgi:hypothetical protein